MTTPAKNIDVSTTSLSSYRYKLGSNPYTAWTAPSSVVNGVHRYVRPASGNATRDHGLLKCRSWTCKAGDLAVNLSSVESFREVPGNVYIQEHNGPTYAGRLLLAGKEPVVPTPNMENWALVKAKNKLKDQDFHLGNFIGEWHQTKDLLKTNAGRIAKTIEKFRRKYPKDFALARANQIGTLRKDLQCKIPSAWLELQYGWIPLMSDIYGAVAHLHKTANRRGLANIVVTSSVEDNVSTVTSQNYQSPNEFYSYKGTTEWISDRKVHVSLAYKISNWTVAELSSLGLLNPLEVVWETTRFSFVVDWFLPIGPWLGSLTGDAGMEFVTGSVTKFSRSYHSGHYALSSNSANASVISDGGPVCTGSLIDLSRTCLTATPFPGLFVKNPISRLHVANAIALLVQAFRR